MSTLTTMPMVTLLLAAMYACHPYPTQASDLAAAADVRVSNSHLVPICMNGSLLSGNQRKWKLSEKTSFVFTMRNEPRSGVPNNAPGQAAIEFTPEEGHIYEIGVRGDAAAFSRRVWKRGEWKPVVRDRTTDQIVSEDPIWVDHGCDR
jgi:hypothetical protein